MQNETRNCQNCKNDFIIDSEDFNFYEKIKVPPPTFCPECRNQRRMSWRNERSLHKIKCKVPGHSEEILSMYNPEKSHNIFDHDYWWSDKWDPLNYGQDYDFSKPFFLQFFEFLRKVPLANLSNINSINSEYTNFVDGNKNCYLLFGAGWNENVRYGNKVMSCKDSLDLLMCGKCELSYECVGCVESYGLIWSKNCKNCTNSYLLYDCRNCTNCFGCANLVSKSYCIWNKQFTREEYFKELEKMNIGSYKQFEILRNKFIKEIYLKAIHRFANIFNAVNSTGDNINNSKNCKNCFDIFEGVEDSKFMYSALGLKNCYDGNGIYDNELSYEQVDSNSGFGNLATVVVYDSQEVKYSYNCHNCKYCFGCSGLRSKQYCILNKQYSKQEYEKLLSEILLHMNDMPYKDSKGRIYKYGDFFPVDLSPFYYNETIAQEYFPVSYNKARDLGFPMKEKELRNYNIEIDCNNLPDDTSDTNLAEQFVGKTISCLHFKNDSHDSDCEFPCTEAFKVLTEDLLFYKRFKIPLPRLCPNCRHYKRLEQKNSLKLWHRKCMKEGCSNEFETSYAPERPEIVYCEKCYQAEVY